MTTKAATKKSTEIATISDNTQALVAAFSGEDYSDSIQVEFSTFPTIKLIQATSKEYVDNLAQPGEFFHNILKTPLTSPLTFIPLMVRETFVIWKPITEGGGMIARSTDGKTWDKPNFPFQLNIDGTLRTFNTKANVKASGLANWGSSVPGNPNSKPVADKSIVIFGLLKDHPEYGPFRILIRSSALKETNKFLQLLAQRRAKVISGAVSYLPPFAFQFDLTSVRVKEENKSWFVPVFSNLSELDILGDDKAIVESMRDIYTLHKAQFDAMAVMETDNETPEQAPIPEGTEF